jgi:hypothetical protein
MWVSGRRERTMGIIKWWNDVWNKPAVKVDPVLSDAIRVNRYVEDGGEVVDLTNRPRIKGDGFPPDQELLHPWNEAHRGMKEGLMRGGSK